MKNNKKTADTEKMIDAIGFIDDDMICEYDEMCREHDKEHIKMRDRKRYLDLWRRAVPLAACFMLIIGGVMFALGGLGQHFADSLDGDQTYISGKNEDAENGAPNISDGAYDCDPPTEAEPADPSEDNTESFPDLEELLKLSDDEIKAVIKANSNYYKTYVYHWNSHISQNTSNSCNFSVDNGSNITFTWDRHGNIAEIIINRNTSDS